MAYQLKTSGIAANCLMAIAVDPDTNAIKDFASATVTADMTIGGSITVGSQAWDGITRKYFQLAASNYVGFGTNKPSFTFNASNTQRTVIWIGEVAGSGARVFGNNSSEYFAAVNTGIGGNTHPTAIVGTNPYSGTGASPVAGNKRIFGWSLVGGGATNSSFIYSAEDTASSGTVTPKTVGLLNVNYTIDYVGRRKDNTTQQNDKIHAVLIFNTALSQADFDSLRDDWFGTLFEVAGAAPHNVTIANSQQSNVGAAGSVSQASTHLIAVANSQQVNTASSAAILQTGAGTIALPALKDWGTGNVKANETGVTLIINNATTGALVSLLTGQTTNASGVLPTLTGLVSGTAYRITTILADGSEGTWKYTAA